MFSFCLSFLSVLHLAVCCEFVPDSCSSCEGEEHSHPLFSLQWHSNLWLECSGHHHYQWNLPCTAQVSNIVFTWGNTMMSNCISWKWVWLESLCPDTCVSWAWESPELLLIWFWSIQHNVLNMVGALFFGQCVLICVMESFCPECGRCPDLVTTCVLNMGTIIVEKFWGLNAHR